MVYEPTTNFKDSNGVDLGKKLITQDYVATVYPSLTQSAAGFIASPAELYIWGGNGGSFGDNLTSGFRSTPTLQWLNSTDWKQLAFSQGSTVCGIKMDGTLWCWGINTRGEVGDNTNAIRSTPRQISAGAGIGVNGWKMVAGGNSFFAAIRNDGTLWTWGFNNNQNLGDNTNTSRSTPRQISSGAGIGVNGWNYVACGPISTFAIRNDGTLWGVGYNFYGTLGNNRSGLSGDSNSLVQEATLSTNWKQVSASGTNQYATAAIKKDGSLWTWGQFAALGTTTNVDRSTPIREFTSSTNWKQVSGFANGFMAIKTDGSLWGWGTNTNGQLGTNDTAFRSTPSREFSASTNWKSLYMGRTDSTNIYAIKTDGSLWGWGLNTSGQLGLNDRTGRATPCQEFTSSTNWRFVAAGSGNVAAIKFPVGR